MNLEMFYFGAIDNGVLLLSMAIGIEIGELLLPKKYRSGAAAAAVSAFVGNAISDAVAGLPSGLAASVWVFLGCLAPGLAIPIIMRRIKAKEDAKEAALLVNGSNS